MFFMQRQAAPPHVAGKGKSGEIIQSVESFFLQRGQSSNGKFFLRKVQTVPTA